MASYLNNNQTKDFHENGYVIVKNFFNENETYLLPENKDFEAIKFDEGNEVVIWGVVTNVLHKV